MTDCEWFEKEGLSLIEKGKSVSHHLSSCSICQEKERHYSSVTLLIKNHRRNESLPDDWKESILNAPAKESARSKPWIRWAGLAATAIFAGLFLSLSLHKNSEFEFAYSLTSGEDAYRNNGVSIGDTLMLEASGIGERFYELRVYLNNKKPVFRCGKTPKCTISGETATAELDLTVPGTYRAVALYGNSPLPDTFTSLDADVLALREQGFMAIVGNEIVVQ